MYFLRNEILVGILPKYVQFQNIRATLVYFICNMNYVRSREEGPLDHAEDTMRSIVGSVSHISSNLKGLGQFL